VPWSVKLLVLLLPYAILLTIYTVHLLKNRPVHPLEQMADQGLYEDYLDGKRKLDSLTLDQATASRPKHEVVDPAIELSPEPPLNLGETRKFPMLEVTPLTVERGRWTYAYKNETENLESRDEGLILHLRCKNISKVIFHPHDPLFNRAAGKHLVYTFLTLGAERYYGPSTEILRERIKGQNFAELFPGKEADTFILAAPHAGPKGELLAELDKLPKDTLVTWRVHLRRGQEKVKAGKEERWVWVTMVLPVQFRIAQVKQAKGGDVDEH
jgi:hypothetical protein